MPRFVALLRGINVGKAKRIAMADLRTLLVSLGYANVQTLLNSGNAVFNGPDASQADQARRIQAAIATTLGVDTFVIVKSAAEMAKVVTENRLAGSAVDASRLLVALTQETKTLTPIATLGQTDWGAEAVHIGKHAAYVWCENGILQSKAAVALLKGLADAGTTRNWATIEKIHALLQADPPD
jgi:uncharacterized protein (DUF1697 family)